MFTRATDRLLKLLKFIGVFALCRKLKRPGVIILGYHGISVLDEHLLMPKLFMRKEKFLERMEILRRSGLKVIDLENAVKLLNGGARALEQDSVVITLDDGWYGCGDVLLECRRRFALPFTLYVTTYYAEHRVPVYNVLFTYLLRKAAGQTLQLGALIDGREETYDLAQPSAQIAARDALYVFIEQLQKKERLPFASRVARALGFPLEQTADRFFMMLLSVDDLRVLAESGIDIQLHTHRHLENKVAEERDVLEEELLRNRNVLGKATSEPLHHFAYPSGVFHPRQVQWLQSLGVTSAATCKPGWNFPGKSSYELNRFLDSDDISNIRFEAELSGFGDLVRSFKHFAQLPKWISAAFRCQV